ncbi:MAG: hypothetical protein K1X39_07080 [Thermoflexales bacterium]|nr:hypothetical protein [Thermoflexales bacterium]
MSDLFKKLNLTDQTEILVIDAPASVEPEIAALVGVKVVRQASKVRAPRFALVFATTLAQVEAAARGIAARATGDPILWMAYPKGSSKTYRCEFNRDNGWQALGEVGYEPVRQVAIDADWSALRFRRVENIQRMTRSFAMTAEGKRKAGKRP